MLRRLADGKAAKSNFSINTDIYRCSVDWRMEKRRKVISQSTQIFTDAPSLADGKIGRKVVVSKYPIIPYIYRCSVIWRMDKLAKVAVS